jgi:hypothetical protein
MIGGIIKTATAEFLKGILSRDKALAICASSPPVSGKMSPLSSVHPGA